MGLFQRDEPMARRPEHLIARLCRESGRWLLLRQEYDAFWVRADDACPIVEILIRCRDNSQTVLFQAFFGIQFPLDNPPSGLFGRVLLRSHELHLAHWGMYIGESCEACLYVAAMLPQAALSALLFDKACREIRDEINGFHRELHDKFHYAAPPPVRNYGGGQPEVRYVEPTPPPTPALPSAAEAWRMIQDHAGPVRYRLPRPGG